MPVDEKIAWLALGCAVGFVFGYIVARLREIKEKEDTIESKVDNLMHREKDEEGALRFSWTGLAVLVVVLLTAYAAFVSGHTANQVEDKVQSDKVALCRSGVESRQVQRGLVEAIYELATGSLERPKGAKPLTKVEIEQYNAYIDRVNKFRSDMYAQIKPSEACAPYVEDENVKPPTAPYPNISK